MTSSNKMKTRSLTEKLNSNRISQPETPSPKKRKTTEDEEISPYFQLSPESSKMPSTSTVNVKNGKYKNLHSRKKILNEKADRGDKEEEEKPKSSTKTKKIKTELKKFRNVSASDDDDFEPKKCLGKKKSGKTEKHLVKVGNGRKNEEKSSNSTISKTKNLRKPLIKCSTNAKNKLKTVSSDSDTEWEEVESKPSTIAEIPCTSKSEHSIEITVNAPKKKKQMDMEKMIQREINKFKREKREKLHKIHLLAYFAHGIRLSRACNDPLAQSLALSLIPAGFCNIKPADFDSDSLKRFVKWFKSAFVLCQELDEFESCTDWEICLFDKLDRKVFQNYKQLALIFVAMVRSMSLNARFVSSIHPYSLKEDDDVIAAKSSDKKKSTKISSKKKLLLNGSAQNLPDAKKISKEEKSDKKRVDFWAEVFLESVEKWICINFITASIGDASSIEENCSQPISYVLACDFEHSIKDVTPRYVANFAAPNVRRHRLKDLWYEKTLKLFKTKLSLRDRLEDLELQAKLSELPMPTTINEFKNHPLYVLKRDLLKFQGIHPPETIPVGFVRNEPVYPRNAVHMLHSKETWRKDARMVRSGEEPVKIVKARPKPHVPKEEQVDRPLPLFGFWQTDPYVSPPAVNGIVPRNEYGSVELFKPSMLPAGTVYLPHPGLLQVAKKLDIDCAPAMVGWDFHAGGSHPLLEGWVVCEEHKEILIAAWDQEQSIIAQRDIERKSKRALANWKKFIKGLLLREKVREKFQQKHPAPVKATTAESDEQAGCSSTFWPQCRMDFNLDDNQEKL